MVVVMTLLLGVVIVAATVTIIYSRFNSRTTLKMPDPPLLLPTMPLIESLLNRCVVNGVMI